VVKAITLSIRQQFAKPWPTWGAIPKDHQELFFQCFKVTYSPLNELVKWLKWVAHVSGFFFIWKLGNAFSFENKIVA